MDAPADMLPHFRSRPADGVDPLVWLAAQPSGARSYFASRDGEYEIAGVGRSLRVTARDATEIGAAWERIARLCERADGAPLCWLGGQAFDPAASGDDALWNDFPVLDFSVPEVMVCRRGDSVTMTTCTAAGDGSKGRAHPPAAFDREDLPDRATWQRHVASALEAIDGGRIEKVVLSRRSTFTFTDTVDPVACLAALRARDCYAFLFEPTAGRAFLSLTPERLLRLDGRAIRTEAVAGTAPAADAAMLADCDKNNREHAFVSDHVAARLGEICTRIESRPRQTVTLRSVAHLATRFTGELASDISLGRVVDALHPTPAVCGTPPAAALSRIRCTEPLRGWYTGLVGMIEPGRAELAVAIRSALVDGKKLTAFAGAGIVTGSEPAAEWRELEVKIQPFLDTFSGA